jgi:hypothetical protein
VLPEIYALGAAIGGLLALLKSEKEDPYERTLKNIKRLERENRWLDARNAASQLQSRIWGEQTRSRREQRKL